MLSLGRQHMSAAGLGALARLPRPTISSTRFLSGTPSLSSNRVKYHNALYKTFGPEYRQRTISTEKLFDALRDMESYRGITPSGADKISEFRSALRAIYHYLGTARKKDELSIGDLEKVITVESGVTWRMIHDLLTQGEVPELANLDAETKAAMAFNRCHGFGRIYARSFASAGARSAEDLLSSTSVEFGRKVSKAQKLGLQYRKDMEVMIPREEIEQLQQHLRTALQIADPEFGFEIMGSFRRGEPVSSDVDMVVWHPSFVDRDPEEKRTSRRSLDPQGLMGRVTTAMFDAGLLHPDRIFSQGERKFLALTRLPTATDGPFRQIDIRLCPLASLPYMLLGNTGDDELMKYLRGRAMAKGWVLNEYAMGRRELKGSATTKTQTPVIKKGTEFIVKDEKEIFAKLEVPYLEPTQRSFHTYRKLLYPTRNLNGPHERADEEAAADAVGRGF